MNNKEREEKKGFNEREPRFQIRNQARGKKKWPESKDLAIKHWIYMTRR